MDHHLIDKIQEMNRNNDFKILFTIQKQYYYQMEKHTFDYFIDCTFMDLKNSELKQVGFTSEQSLANAIDFMIANPTYQFEDLRRFSLPKVPTQMD